jgi:hypothetical protein
LDAVEGLELLALFGLERVEVYPTEPLLQGVRDVVPGPPRLLGHVSPGAHHLFGLVEHRHVIGQESVVGKRHSGRFAIPELAERCDRLVEVEVGGRGCRPEHPWVGKANSYRVSGEEDPASTVVQSKMMLGVTRRVDRGERPAAADIDHLTVFEDVHPLRRGWFEAAVQRIEERAVDLGRGCHQAGRVDEVTGTSLVDVHGGLGKGLGYVSDTAGVIEVDVGYRDAR